MKRFQKGHQIHRAIRFFLIAGTLLLVIHCLPPGAEKAACAGSDPKSPMIQAPPGLKPMGPPEVHGPDSLYEKINGQAELYLAAGFNVLTHQWFGEDDDPDTWVEVYVYHMGEVANAFSVYSLQRREDGRKLDLAPFAYHTENAVYLVHGPFYMEIIAAEASEETLSLLLRLAENFVDHNKVEQESVHGLELFPQENLEKGSIVMIAGNAFGYEGLDRVFTAAYTMDGSRVTAFVSKRKTPREAKDLALKYHQFLKSFDGKEVRSPGAFGDVKMIEVMDTFFTVFTHGVYLAGVHEASSKEEAERLSGLLAERLRKIQE